MRNQDSIFKREFLKTCTQFERIYVEIEKQEYLKLKEICPRISKTNHVNQAIQICLTCTAAYCLPKPDHTGEIINE